jgi:hypothetical protein
LEDVKNPEIQVEPEKLQFRGIGGPEKKKHFLEITFFKEIDTEVKQPYFSPIF